MSWDELLKPVGLTHVLSTAEYQNSVSGDSVRLVGCGDCGDKPLPHERFLKPPSHWIVVISPYYGPIELR